MSRFRWWGWLRPRETELKVEIDRLLARVHEVERARFEVSAAWAKRLLDAQEKIRRLEDEIRRLKAELGKRGNGADD